jgi:hypothetical protein
MRGDDNQQEGMFSYISPEKRVPADHPLRPIRKMVDEILKEMSPQFAKLYSDVGRPSIAPERLLRALLLQIFYSVRSERMLIEQLQYNMLFRWFVGMEMPCRDAAASPRHFAPAIKSSTACSVILVQTGLRNESPSIPRKRTKSKTSFRCFDSG